MYVARDEDGEAFLYSDKPEKNECEGFWYSDGLITSIGDSELPKSIDPQWSDPEPIKVKLVRNNK